MELEQWTELFKALEWRYDADFGEGKRIVDQFSVGYSTNPAAVMLPRMMNNPSYDTNYLAKVK